MLFQGKVFKEREAKNKLQHGVRCLSQLKDRGQAQGKSAEGERGSGVGLNWLQGLSPPSMA